MRKVNGVGINDADYTVQIRKTLSGTGNKRKRVLVWSCPYYRTWISMINRCYDSNYCHKTNYENCTVCEEWLTFSNFKTWMEKQDWENKRLDKDLFNKDKHSLVYSPETCVFIPQILNSFLCASAKARGACKIGVTCNKSGGYSSKISNPFTSKTEHLGEFKIEENAYLAWLKRKLELAEEICLVYNIEDKIKVAVNNYIRNIY